MVVLFEETQVNIFVLGTGRCGTSTFYQACLHITNYTAGHESKARQLGDYAFPKNHIEVASQLVIKAGQLLRDYPTARWIHLIRNRDACIRSLAAQSQHQLCMFTEHWNQAFQSPILDCAAEFYDVINANITAMLRGQDYRVFHLENAPSQWAEFWHWIGAEGDFNQSVREWQRRYNSSQKRGRDNYV